MFVVGLTGNYGMGKSSVLKLFGEYGAYTIDSDLIVAELLQNKAVIKKISMLLGAHVLFADRSLNKTMIAELIFHDQEARKNIEALLHPLVFQAVKAAIKKVKKDIPLVMVEVPLLFEGGFQKNFDRTITVYTKQNTALMRLKKAGVSRKNALARLHSQMNIRKKKRLADYVIDNNGMRLQSRSQVKKIYRALVKESNQ